MYIQCSKHEWSHLIFIPGTSLAVQWWRLHAFTARGTGLIPGQGTKIPHAIECGQNSFLIKKVNRLLCKAGSSPSPEVFEQRLSNPQRWTGCRGPGTDWEWVSTRGTLGSQCWLFDSVIYTTSCEPWVYASITNTVTLCFKAQKRKNNPKG